VEFERRAAEALAGASAEACERALALYTGDLLVENRYDAWLDARRERLRSLRLDLLEQLATIYEANGDEWSGLAATLSMLNADPFDEPGVRRWMRILAAAGHRDRALRHYDELAARLGAELDAEPDAETRALRDEILAASPPPRPRVASSGLPR